MEYRKASHKRKVIETLILFSGYVALGISGGMPGPTLLDLQELTHSETDEISVVFIVKSIGGLIGGSVAALLISRLNPWMLFAASIGFSGLMQVIVPLCTNLVALGVVMTLGTTFGILYDSGGNMQLIKIWGDDHEPWMQALHCVFGISALLGPLIATPFLSATNEESLAVNTTSVTTNLTITSDEPTTNVRYAYFISGGLLLIHGIIFFVLYTIGDTPCCIKKQEGTDQHQEEERLADFNKPFLITFVILVFLFYWMYCILELTYANYLTTYVVDELSWSKTAGATLTSVFWASFTIGRGAGIFVVKYVKPESLLISMSIMTIISIFPEVFFSNAHFSVMWITTVAFGLSVSTIYASGLTYSNMYIPFSGGIGALFIGAGSLGDLTGPVFIVPLFGTYGMQVFVVLLFVAAIVMFLVFMCSLLLGKKHGKRSKYLCEKIENETSPLLGNQKVTFGDNA